MNATTSPYPLSKWRWIVVNSSGGKDSQTALRYVVNACRSEGLDLSRVVVSHQCLGDAEWDGTLDLVRRQADEYGLRLEVTRYRNKHGVEGSLLDYVKRRGKWPDNKNRYCTSDFKRGPGRRVITKLYRECEGPMLNVFGFRSEESPARAKRSAFSKSRLLSTKSRAAYDWLPIHDWTERQVWDDIKESGVPYHFAYELGMPRLSCRFCIFAPRDALIVAGRANPELLDEYCEVEEMIGHTFQNGRSLSEIRDAIKSGEQPKNLNGAWNM